MRDAAAALRQLLTAHALHGSRTLAGAPGAVDGMRDAILEAIGVDVWNLGDAVALFVQQNQKAKDALSRLSNARVRHFETASAISQPRFTTLQQQLRGVLSSDAAGHATLTDGLVLTEADLVAAIGGSPATTSGAAGAAGAAGAVSVGSLVTAGVFLPHYDALGVGATHGAVAAAFSGASGVSSLLADLTTAVSTRAAPEVPASALSAHVCAAQRALADEPVRLFAAAAVAVSGGSGSGDATAALPAPTVDQVGTG